MTDTSRSGWSTPGTSETPPRTGDPWAPRPDDTRLVVGSEPPPPPKRRHGTAAVVTLALVAGLLGGGAGAAVVTALDDERGTAPAESSLDQPPAAEAGDSGQTAADLSSIDDVAAEVLPSVVSIAVGRGAGSGVIISSDGQILTNNHVVESGGPITVTFHDGATVRAEVLGTDRLTDLAVIQAQDVDRLTPAELGDSEDLQVGEQVVAIGSPFGLEGTVTAGIVSAVHRPVTAGGDFGTPTVIDAIQTDAPINPGNSGGPLVNMAGQVVGINSVIYSSTGSSVGLGFAIPIDQARWIAEQLVESGTAEHARIGVSIETAQGNVRGVLITAVQPGSGAAEAGLQEGDVVTKVNDRPITDGLALVAAARSFRPGETIAVTYVRAGETHTAEVTLGSDDSAG
ncbi:MAG: trypsin-like peptidase domain-containing protein [Jiangellaceae bacterium]|nr:trypsin-like peptidase domain-containing protein [Jiangellaceae bacterium]